ncbi:MAG: copper transporter [Solirubrobacterales bacterium]
MGYSSRYHVASLAAVFIALAIGILIGAAFGSDVLDDVGRDLEESLKGDLDEANAEIAALEAEVARQGRFAGTVFPALAESTLPGRSIALVAFGERPEAIREDVLAALGPTGAELTQLAVVREPSDSGALAGLRGRGAGGAEGERRRIAGAVRLAGTSLVGGGPFYDVAREALLASFSGEPVPVDGVVVARQRPALDGPEEAATEALEEDFTQGLVAAGVPVVAVERTGSDPSSIGFFDSLGLTTVDNVDEVAGRVALVYALRGSQGNFGIGEEAEELLPGLLRRPGATTAP